VTAANRYFKANSVFAPFLGFLILAVSLDLWANEPEFARPADLPVHAELPDPLLMLDGRKVTSRDMWVNERRPELIRLFQHYMYGQLPPAPMVVGTVGRVDVEFLGGKATLSEITLRFGPAEVPPIHLLLVVPNKRRGPAPVILGMNYFGNHTLVRDPRVRLSDNWVPERGAGVEKNRATAASRGTWADLWPIEQVIDRGYALATFYNGDIDPDAPDRRGLQTYFPAVDPADSCGTIGAWAWGLQRAVDYLVAAPGIDPRRIVVTGHSRLGKAALLAAAFDPRIAIAIPHQAGCGGSAPSRARLALGQPWNTLDAPDTKRPETVADLNDKFPHWFNARFKEFDQCPEKLPFDQNGLVALCAPRPVLFTNGRADTWINPAGQFAVLRSAAPVYELLGAVGFTATELPPDGKPIIGPLGYSLRPGAHSLLGEDWQTFLDFADHHFGAPSGDRRTSTRTSAAGPIEIDPAFPRSFRHQNGQGYYPLGDTAYFLLGRPAETIAHYIDHRRAQGFNFIRAMAIADGFWPFGGTAEKPDYAVINEAALQKLDWVFDYAASRGMNLELILWGYGTAGGEGLWGNERHEHFWVETLIQRYRDRDNLFMYTIANEFERYPDGQYRFDPADVTWARGIAARIRKLADRHPIGCHPSVWITDQDSAGEGPRPFANFQGFVQRRPPVVWPLWAGSAVNVNAAQNNEGVQRRNWGDLDNGGRGLTYTPTNWQGIDYPAQWTPTGWDFEAAGLEDCIAADGLNGKPVLNTEFGYQFEPGYEANADYLTRQVHQPSTVRKKAWKIATSGGYFATGFAGTAVSREWTNRDVDNCRPAAFKTLHDFFTTKTEFWKLSPHHELVSSQNCLLASPGTEYVAYFPRGGANTIRLVAGLYRVEWLHPASGIYHQRPEETLPDGDHEFTPPNEQADDWVLHLLRAEQR